MPVWEEEIRAVCLETLTNQWQQTPDSFPDFLPTYTAEERQHCQEYVKKLTVSLEQSVKTVPFRNSARKIWAEQFHKTMAATLQQEPIFAVASAIPTARLEALQAEIKKFLQTARRDVPELGLPGLGQALRNYLVYTMFNEIHQGSIAFNPAAYSYSMLYPFTDNYLDDPAHSVEDKQNYNQLIRQKIQGFSVTPQTDYERKTCLFLDTIEKKYPAATAPQVRNTLLLMQKAQEDSLKQQKSSVPLSEEKRLEISLFKGGLSVLMDRLFVESPLATSELIFYLSFGFLLQLADDLQDISEDSHQGSQTLCTLPQNQADRQKLVNKIFHFTQYLDKNFPTPNKDFQSFLLRNCRQLLHSCLVKSQDYFDQEYLTALEKHSLLPYPLLADSGMDKIEQADQTLAKRYTKMIDILCATE